MKVHIPTTLSGVKVKEPQDLFERLRGERLSEEEARETTLGLLLFVGIIIREHPKFRFDSEASSLVISSSNGSEIC